MNRVTIVSWIISMTAVNTMVSNTSVATNTSKDSNNECSFKDLSVSLCEKFSKFLFKERYWKRTGKLKHNTAVAYLNAFLSPSATRLLRTISRDSPRVFPGLTEFILNKKVPLLMEKTKIDKHITFHCFSYPNLSNIQTFFFSSCKSAV